MATNDRIYSLTRKKKRIKDKQISFLKQVNYEDNGTVKQTWIFIPEMRNLRAYARQISGQDVYGDIVLTEPMHESGYLFMINYREDLDEKQRIFYNGTMYEIKQFDYFEGYKKDIVITATALA